MLTKELNKNLHKDFAKWVKTLWNDDITKEEKAWLIEDDKRLVDDDNIHYTLTKKTRYILPRYVLEKLITIPEIKEFVGPRKDYLARSFLYKAEYYNPEKKVSQRTDAGLISIFLRDKRFDDINFIVDTLKDVKEEDKMFCHQLLAEVLGNHFITSESSYYKTIFEVLPADSAGFALNLLKKLEGVKAFELFLHTPGHMYVQHEGIVEKGVPLKESKILDLRPGRSILYIDYEKNGITDDFNEKDKACFIPINLYSQYAEFDPRQMLLSKTNFSTLLDYTLNHLKDFETLAMVRNLFKYILTMENGEKIIKKDFFEWSPPEERHTQDAFFPRLFDNMIQSSKNYGYGDPWEAVYSFKELNSPAIDQAIEQTKRNAFVDYRSSAENNKKLFEAIDAKMQKEGTDINNNLATDKSGNKYIAPRPLYVDETTAFLKVLGFANEVINSIDEGHLKKGDFTVSDLFYKLTLNRRAAAIKNGNHILQEDIGWNSILKETQKFYKDLKEVKDTVNEFTTYVVLPYIAAKTPDWQLDDIEDKTIQKFLKHMNIESAKILFEGKDLAQIGKFSKVWHDRREHLLAEIREFAVEGTWHQIFDKKEIEVTSGKAKGWKIVNLTSSRELDDEHKRMAHCINGYSPRCLAGDSHIFSIRNKNGESISTIEVSISNTKGDIMVEDGFYLKIVQHKAYHNDPVPIDGYEKAALDWLADTFKAQRDAKKEGNKKEIENPITVNKYNFGRIKTDANNIAILSAIGMKDPTNKDKRQRVFDIFAARGSVSNVMQIGNDYMMQKKYRKMDVDRFVEMMDFTKLFKEFPGMKLHFKNLLDKNLEAKPANRLNIGDVKGSNNIGNVAKLG